jgi:hypothetical protein
VEVGMTVALRTPPQRAPSRLGPNEALRLSVLGSAAGRPLPLEILIDLAREVGGCCWHPTPDVVLDCVDGLVDRGLLAVVESDRIGISSIVSVTAAGRKHARDLMRLGISTAGEDMSRTLVLLKVAFLDLLEPSLRWREIDSMIDVLRDRVDRRAQIENARRGLGGFLSLALGQETRGIEAQIAWLTALRDAQLERRES